LLGTLDSVTMAGWTNPFSPGTFGKQKPGQYSSLKGLTTTEAHVPKRLSEKWKIRSAEPGVQCSCNR